METAKEFKFRMRAFFSEGPACPVFQRHMLDLVEKDKSTGPNGFARCPCGCGQHGSFKSFEDQNK
jgi:hypothetical protein